MSYLPSYLRPIYRPYDTSRRFSELQLPSELFRKEKSLSKLSSNARNLDHQRRQRELQLESKLLQKMEMELNKDYKIDYLEEYQESLRKRAKSKNQIQPIEFKQTAKMEDKATSARILPEKTQIQQIFQTHASTIPIVPQSIEIQDICNPIKINSNLPILIDTPKSQNSKNKSLTQSNVYSITIAPELKEIIQEPSSNRSSLSTKRSLFNKQDPETQTFQTINRIKQLSFHEIPPIQPLNLHEQNKSKIPKRFPPRATRPKKDKYDEPLSIQKPQLNPERYSLKARQSLSYNQSPVASQNQSPSLDHQGQQEVSNQPGIPRILSTSNQKQLMRNRSLSHKNKKQFLNLVSVTRFES